MLTKILGKGLKLGGIVERVNISHQVRIAKRCVRVTRILPLMDKFRETQELKLPRCSATCTPCTGDKTTQGVGMTPVSA